MNLTLPVRLAPTPDQDAAPLVTVERFNEACDWIGEVAYREQIANKVRLQKAVYYDIRERFGLSAQMAIRAIGKVVEAFKRDKSVRPRFRPRGAVPYDERIMSFRGPTAVSLLTLEGRQVIGVDLGVVNIAADSDGNTHTADEIAAVRIRNANLRAALQRKGSRSAKRHLRRVSGREARFRRDVNHQVSKQLVRPRDTSGTCAQCGHCEKANRRSRAEFVCRSCGHAAPADINAASNIAAKATAGVMQPIVSTLDAASAAA
jgi:predicted transposase